MYWFWLPVRRASLLTVYLPEFYVFAGAAMTDISIFFFISECRLSYRRSVWLLSKESGGAQNTFGVPTSMLTILISS